MARSSLDRRHRPAGNRFVAAATNGVVTTDTTSPRATARRVLNEQATCTLATASADGAPEAATVRFVTDEALNLCITTESTYRKYQNMMANPRVAVVVDGDEANLQLEGTATEVHGEAAAAIEQQYIDKYGKTQYLTNEWSVFFEIQTDWARVLVDGQYPPTYEMVIGEGEANGLEER